MVNWNMPFFSYTKRRIYLFFLIDLAESVCLKTANRYFQILLITVRDLLCIKIEK